MAYNHSSTSSSRELKRADPNTIQDKFMVGYQGWFTCAGDGQPLDPHHHGWLHWITEPLDGGGRPNTDLWPDLTAYDDDELYPVPGLQMQSGEQARLFSSRHPKTVRRHFHWMAEHGVDGVFLQRFVGQCDVEGSSNIRDQRDEVGRRVREAAEAEGRVWAIMYDVSGVPADRIERVIKEDWMHLIHKQRILDSPSYLREKGRPVLAIWGLGFSDRDYTIHQVREIYSFVRNQTPGGVYTVAGVPAHWRTSVGDAVEDPDFVQFFLNEPDALSPWTIGRYGDENGADNFAEEKIKGDMEAIKKQNEENERRYGEGAKRLDYMPVVFPGGSGFNLSEGKWGFNDIKRNGGRFLWRQVWNAKRQGVRIMYGAMWDEYDEGTAFLPVVSHKRLLPKSDKWPFLSLDEEGHDLPSDWYMRIAGFAAEGLRSERMVHETFPIKELQDYWSTRPRFEEPASSSSGTASGSGSGSGNQSMQAWEATQAKPDVDEPPPPPYTLEAEAAAATPAAVPTPSQPHQDPVANITASMAGAAISSGPSQQHPIQSPSQGYQNPANPHRQSSGYQAPAIPIGPGQPLQTQTGAPWPQSGGAAPSSSLHQSSYGPSPTGNPYGIPQGPSGGSFVSNSPPVTSPQSTIPPWGPQPGAADPKQQSYAPPSGPPHVSPQRTGSYPSPTHTGSMYGQPNPGQGQYPPASWDMKQSGGGPIYPQHSGSSTGGGYHPGYQSTPYGAPGPQQPYGAPSPGPGPSYPQPYGQQGGYANPAHQSSIGPAGYPPHSPPPGQLPYAPYAPQAGVYNQNSPYFPMNSPAPNQPHAPYGGAASSPPPHQPYAPYGGASTSPAPVTPPALPARPSSQSSGSYTQGQAGPSKPYAAPPPPGGSSASSSFGRPVAMGLDSLGSTVERIGGKNVRKHFDRGVKELDGVVNTGNKLLSKFMK